MRFLVSLLLLLTLCLFTAPSDAATPPRDPTPRQPISLTLRQEYTLADDLHEIPDSQDIFRVRSGAAEGDVQRNLNLNLEDIDNTSSRSGSELVSGQASATAITLHARPTLVWRPRDPEALQRARVRSLRHAESEVVEWEQVEVLGPDIEDRHTLGQLARMTGNAYALPGQKNWYDIDEAWNTSFPFGWEDEADGFRGHVFTNPANTTVVLSIKGTTLQGPTSKKDKFNDNLLFSCCCARIDLTWIFSTVCDCYTKHWQCDSQCLSDALVEDSLFYNVGTHLINNLTAIYPYSTIWLVGHSLGGALASLLGTTFGLPAVAFESPGELMAAHRLHLPLPPTSPAHPFSPSYAYPSFSTPPPSPHAPVTHVYHTADPIPQGTCTGFGSPCVATGYALETRCHLGKSIVYDTVSKLGWNVDVRKHTIKEVILGVVEKVWESGEGWELDDESVDGRWRDVPKARVEEDCIDCFKWEFGDFKDRKLISGQQ